MIEVNSPTNFGDGDDDVSDLLFEDQKSDDNEPLKDEIRVSAEILKVEDAENRHVIEFRRQEGNTMSYREHVQKAISAMLSSAQQ